MPDEPSSALPVALRLSSSAAALLVVWEVGEGMMYQKEDPDDEATAGVHR